MGAATLRLGAPLALVLVLVLVLEVVVVVVVGFGKSAAPVARRTAPRLRVRAVDGGRAGRRPARDAGRARVGGIRVEERRRGRRRSHVHDRDRVRVRVRVCSLGGCEEVDVARGEALGVFPDCRCGLSRFGFCGQEMTCRAYLFLFVCLYLITMFACYFSSHILILIHIRMHTRQIGYDMTGLTRTESRGRSDG